MGQTVSECVVAQLELPAERGDMLGYVVRCPYLMGCILAFACGVPS